MSLSPSSKFVWGELGPSSLYCFSSKTNPFLNSATSYSVYLANIYLLPFKFESFWLALITKFSQIFSSPNADSTDSYSTGCL